MSELFEPYVLSPEADLLWALRELNRRRRETWIRHRMHLTACQTEAGATFWRGWDMFCAKTDGKLVDPVPEEIRDSAGFGGLHPMFDRHRDIHGCLADVVCRDCGCFCRYHEIDGRCFARHTLVSFNIPTNWSEVPRNVLGYRFCACTRFRPFRWDKPCLKNTKPHNPSRVVRSVKSL